MPAPHEHLDELGRVGHHDEVAGQGELGAAAGRGAVHRGDHRLLAVEHRADEPLPAGADEPGRVARRPGRARPRASGRRGSLGAAERGAGAEVAVAGAAQHDHPHVQVLGGLGEAIGQPVAHVGA